MPLIAATIGPSSDVPTAGYGYEGLDDAEALSRHGKSS